MDDGDERLTLREVRQVGYQFSRRFDWHVFFTAELYETSSGYWSLADQHSLVEIGLSLDSGLLSKVVVVLSPRPVSSFDRAALDALPAQSGVPVFDRNPWRNGLNYYRVSGTHRLLFDDHNYLVELFATPPRTRVDIESVSLLFDSAQQLCACLIRDVTPVEQAQLNVDQYSLRSDRRRQISKPL